jgi:hypothetical protein
VSHVITVPDTALLSGRSAALLARAALRLFSSANSLRNTAAAAMSCMYSHEVPFVQSTKGVVFPYLPVRQNKQGMLFLRFAFTAALAESPTLVPPW